MNYTEIRKLSLKIFLGFLGLTALIAIISVLSGQFGELQVKILATSFTISAASICSMSCVAFIEKKRLIKLGIFGIILCVVSAILVIAGIWPNIDSDGYWKATHTLIIAAVAFAHAFLLVLPQLDDKHKWVQRVSSVSIGILALQIAVAVWGLWDLIDDDSYLRLLAVVAIIVALETLAIPLLMKLRKGNGQERQKLVLEKLKGDIYTDSAGKPYQLKQFNPEQDG
jgi:hypothetical protein